VSRCFAIERDGVRLACRELAGSGSPVLLLHGLAGYAGEWSQTARWLGEHHRVVAFDARGHGHSERAPLDVSCAAHVADAAYVIERLELGPCTVIGQSLGGVTALLLAAAHPELVHSLIVAEASPVAPDEASIEEIERLLARWPVPLRTRSAAIELFGGPSLAAETWAGGLEQRDDGLWPRFDLPVMTRTLREALPESCWQEWERISCPTLIVRSGNGTLSARDAQRMVERLPGSRLAEIAETGHDVHLERPTEWRHTIEGFLASLNSTTPPARPNGDHGNASPRTPR
jgi:pimeloyl-ACP methyl ester carboxylesterase